MKGMSWSHYEEKYGESRSEHYCTECGGQWIYCDCGIAKPCGFCGDQLFFDDDGDVVDASGSILGVSEDGDIHQHFEDKGGW